MKSMRSILGGLLLMISLVVGLHFLHAQTAVVGGFNNGLAPVEPAPADSIVQIAAEAQGLQLVPPDQVPLYGTFWMVLPEPNGGVMPPFPCPPLDLSLPVYAIADGQFLVDGTVGSQATLNAPQAGRLAAGSTSAAALEAQADAVVNLITQVQTAAASQQMRAMAQTMDSGVPSPPGEGEEGGEGGSGGSGWSGWSYPSNGLSLQIVAFTNQTGYFVVHTPETNGVHDLFLTTNLSPNVPGLNLTNWTWALRTLPGQTNVTVTNLTAPEGYFRLGLTNDTDGGGFSDAFEHLVTHTDPNNPNDDRLTPLVGIVVLDAVALEQYLTNTARFAIRRLGGYMSQPLIVGCQLSGTASNGTDYYLSPVTVTPTNVLVTIPPPVKPTSRSR